MFLCCSNEMLTVITFSKQFSRAQTPIVYKVNPPSGVPGKKFINKGINKNLFTKAIVNSSTLVNGLHKQENLTTSLMLF